MKPTSSLEFQQFAAKPWWYKARGIAMIFIGGSIALLCIGAHDVQMLGKDSSWLPIIGLVLLAVGALRAIDGYLAKSTQGFILNMQGGILDIVVGSIILFSINSDPSRLSFLIAGYLLTQGILRNILILVVQIMNPHSNRITGLISIILGIGILFDIPYAAAWVLALAVSVDIGFRGWGLIILAESIKREEMFEARESAKSED